ncbi:acyl-CoA dehydrogenase family protein, partial [Nocardia cyriacigeorgica]|uniref:acyl-CoA dehydrogenase family protein n=1 Tax=Nocardia cyriacigeorgica TaxID=135487 RepID=UPI003CC80A4A
MERDELTELFTAYGNDNSSELTWTGAGSTFWVELPDGRTLCEQVGVAALAIPEEYGGFGASLAESLLVVGELGRSLAGVPMLG